VAGAPPEGGGAGTGVGGGAGIGVGLGVGLGVGVGGTGVGVAVGRAVGVGVGFTEALVGIADPHATSKLLRTTQQKSVTTTGKWIQRRDLEKKRAGSGNITCPFQHSCPSQNIPPIDRLPERLDRFSSLQEMKEDVFFLTREETFIARKKTSLRIYINSYNRSKR
jgi:hypothetical protein